MTVVLGVFAGEGAISLVLVSTLESDAEHHQRIDVADDDVATFAECIGVAVAATPRIGAVGICLSDPDRKADLVDALGREGVVNFRIVDRKNAIEAYRRRANKPTGFQSATEVLALGAAAYASRKGPVRRFASMGRPNRIPGGPMGAAAAALVCASAITLGYAQNNFTGASDSSLGGPTFAFPTPPKGFRPRPIHLNVRPVYVVSPETPDPTQQQPNWYGRTTVPAPESPLQVTMPDGKVINVDLPPMLEPPRDMRAWLRQFLMPPANAPQPQAPPPVPAAPPQPK